MRDSLPSDGLLLPFGSLTGVVPVDSVLHGRAHEDFMSALSGRRMSELQQQIHSVIDPVLIGLPPSLNPSGGGGI